MLWLCERHDEISTVKAVANSNRLQRQRYFRYTQEGTLSMDLFGLTQQALLYLARVPVARLSSACPALVDFLRSKFQLTNETTIEQLIGSSSNPEGELIMRELLHGCEKHLSALFVGYIDSHPVEKIPVEELYPIFMLSKHVCNNRSEFALKLS